MGTTQPAALGRTPPACFGTGSRGQQTVCLRPEAATLTAVGASPGRPLVSHPSTSAWVISQHSAFAQPLNKPVLAATVASAASEHRWVAVLSVGRSRSNCPLYLVASFDGAVYWTYLTMPLWTARAVGGT